MSGTVLVAYQWAPSAQGTLVTESGQVDASRATVGLSDSDHVAIEFARGLADQAGARLVALGVGPEAVSAGLATKAVASRGPDEVVVVRDATPTTISVAQALAAQASGMDDLVALVLGDASNDHGTRMVPGVVAGLLGRPLLADVRSVTLGEPATVVTKFAGGTQTLQAYGTLVVQVAPDAVKPRVPGMRDILAAAKKPVQVVDVSASIDNAGVTPISVSPVQPPSRGGRVITADTPAAAVAQLVNELSQAGVL